MTVPQVGDRVRVCHSDGYWYYGTLRESDKKGKLTVAFDDGDRSAPVHAAVQSTVHPFGACEPFFAADTLCLSLLVGSALTTCLVSCVQHHDSAASPRRSSASCWFVFLVLLPAPSCITLAPLSLHCDNTFSLPVLLCCFVSC